MATYTIENHGQQSRIVMNGDLTASIIPELQPRLKEALDKGAQEMIFDLGKTAMLDSSGIGLLIATYNSLNRLAGRLCVVNVSPNIHQLLQSMRLASRLNVSGVATT